MVRTMRSVITALIMFFPLVASGDEWVAGAVRVETPPVIDGVWEDVWHLGTPAVGVRQFRPEFGKAADADTEVYVLYDDYALYVGWVCREPEPEHLVASAGVHDMFLNYDDCVDLLSFSISVGYDAFLGSGRVPQGQYMDFDTDENPDSLALWRITQCGRACLAKPI